MTPTNITPEYLKWLSNDATSALEDEYKATRLAKLAVQNYAPWRVAVAEHGTEREAKRKFANTYDVHLKIWFEDATRQIRERIKRGEPANDEYIVEVYRRTLANAIDENVGCVERELRERYPKVKPAYALRICLATAAAALREGAESDVPERIDAAMTSAARIVDVEDITLKYAVATMDDDAKSEFERLRALHVIGDRFWYGVKDAAKYDENFAAWCERTVALIRRSAQVHNQCDGYGEVDDAWLLNAWKKHLADDFETTFELLIDTGYLLSYPDKDPETLKRHVEETVNVMNVIPRPLRL